jgi:hypothetical protein
VLYVNSWKRLQAIRRLLLILAGGCVLGMIAVVLWSPELRDRISDAVMAQIGGHASVPPPPAEEPSEPAAAKKITQPVRRPQNPPEPVEDVTEPVAVEGPPPEPPSSAPADPLHANVKSDSAAAYSFNSSRSPIVHVLKKGDKVQTTLEVIDSEGRWNLIRTPDSKRSAFVRSEDLERPPADANSAK